MRLLCLGFCTPSLHDWFLVCGTLSAIQYVFRIALSIRPPVGAFVAITSSDPISETTPEVPSDYP